VARRTHEKSIVQHAHLTASRSARFYGLIAIGYTMVFVIIGYG